MAFLKRKKRRQIAGVMSTEDRSKNWIHFTVIVIIEM